MKVNHPLCYLFKTFRNHYLFDTNRNQILQITQKVSDLLESCLLDKDFYESADNIEDTEFRVFYKKAISNGYFSRHRVKKIEHPITGMLPQMLSKGLNGVALQVTQLCNLRCEYCPYSGNLYTNRSHSTKKMTWETAKKALDFYIKNTSESNIVALAFYGGEPLLEFELMKKCILYIESKITDKPIRIDVTTNGTLLNDEIVDFFNEHQIRLLVSLDGPEEIHDRYRRYADGRGSFAKVIENVKKYSHKYPEYFKNTVMFNAVINTDRAVSCINNFFEVDSTFADSIINASMIKETELKDGIIIQAAEEHNCSVRFESFKVILNRLGLYNGVNFNRPSIFTSMYYSIREFSKNLKPIYNLPDTFHPSGPCIPGIKKFFITVDGEFYPCERVDEQSEELNIGNLEDGINIDKIARVINIGQLTAEKCTNCWAFLLCTQCCSHCDTNGTLSAETRLKNCEDVCIMAEITLQHYCMYQEFGYDFGIEKTFHFMKRKVDRI